MAARPGTDNPLSGPRLPRPIDVANPGDGCFNGCGELRRSMLMDFLLVYRGKVAGHWLLCHDCYRWGNPQDPRAADPLTFEEAS